ncbi:MAG: hypothetical protein M0021_07295 [Clostridia bacterium]|nr:hypothetical protein [Clostridia bacterium]
MESALFGVSLAIILIVILFLVGFPLIRKDKATGDKWWEEELVSDLEKDKEAVFTTLNEIEFDFQMKKLSEEDYQILKEKHQRLAVQILKEEEAQQVNALAREEGRAVVSEARKADVEAEIEAELEALKLGK